MLNVLKKIGIIAFLFVTGILIFLSGFILLRPKIQITADVTPTIYTTTNTVGTTDIKQDNLLTENCQPKADQPWAEKLENEDQGRINFLLLGKGGEGHQSGELTDTIMIASFSPLNDQLKLISIPRDLYVKMPEKNYYTRINAIKSKKDLEKKSGITYLQETIKQISGIEIHYYASFDFSDFKDLIDKLGGIDLFFEEPVSDISFPADEFGDHEYFYIPSGENHINGNTALKIVRSRHSYWGDFDRIDRQQKVISAIWEKVNAPTSGKIDGFLKYFNIWNYVRKNIETDIGTMETLRLLDIFKASQDLTISTYTISSKPNGELKNARVKTGNGIAMILLPKDATFETIRQRIKNFLE
ncbi:LytR family transcriptional regulator [bacterium]|nr:MAG: LytR family transcriptional regulator [bacterium]